MKRVQFDESWEIDYLDGDSVMWETHNVTLTKTAPYGFGIAVSGGRDNPHFSSGDPSIAISDVLKGGPAEGLLFINDRVLFVNSVNLENVDYATAISVLKDSGDMVHLVVRRKASPISHCTETVLTRPMQSSMSWGVIIGCKLFVSRILPNSIASINHNVKEGDVIMGINGQKSSNLSLAEAQKLIDRCKGNNLTLSISKYDRETLNRSLQCDKISDSVPISSPHKSIYETTPQHPPLLSNFDTNCDDKPMKRSNDIDSPQKHQTSIMDRRQRNVEFKKGTNGLGIRVSGGNRTGVFVATVTQGAAAYGQLYEGDVLLSVNGMDLTGKTREEVVMTLMNLRDRVELRVEYRKEEFDGLMKEGGSGDSFYVRSHFDYDKPEQEYCLEFKNCDVFHVTDTLYNGVPGYWCVRKVSKSNSNNESAHIGIIPNLENARKYVVKQKELIQLAEDKENKKSGFFRKRAKRSKSLTKDQWEEMIFTNPSTKFDVYERVIPKEPGFIRPVIIFGPLADVAREHLQKDIRVYQSPQLELNEGHRSAIIKLASIRKVIEMNKHCVLDITPSAVDRLQYAQYAPIVIYLKAASKATVKHLRNQYAKQSRKSAKILFEQSIKLEKFCSHLFTDVIFLEGANWLDRIKDSVDRQQAKSIWMMHETNDKSDQSDDVFFPMAMDAGRLSYASGPGDAANNDVVWNNALTNKHEHVYTNSQYPNLEPKPQRVFGRRNTNIIYRTSSDPSLNDADKIPGIPPYPEPPAYFIHNRKANVPPLPIKIGRSKDIETPMKPNTNDPKINGEPIYSRIRPRKFDLVKSQPVSPDKGFSSLNSVKDPMLMYQSQVELDEYLANQQDDVKLRVRKANRQPFSPVTTSGYTSDDQKLNRHQPKLSNNQIYEQSQAVNYRRPRTEYITDKKSFDKYKIKERPLSQYSERDRSIFNYPPIRSAKIVESRHLSNAEGNYGRLSDYRSIGDTMKDLENPLYASAVSRDLQNECDNNNIYSSNATSTFRPNNQQKQPPPKPPVSKKPIITPGFYAKSSNGVPLVQRDRLQSEDGDNPVVATASGIFGYDGGILESPETGVSIIIPKGAIREGREQNIYFKVCKDNSLLPPLDKEKGETLLSPLVMCGPHGLKFDQPVELRLPHCASVNPDSWAFALKSSDSAAGQTSKWQDVLLNEDAISNGNGGGVVGKTSVSVLVDHF